MAAPILKLCDEILLLVPPGEKHCCKILEIVDLVRYVPSVKVNSGSSLDVQFGKCVCKARTGQTLVCEGASFISWPSRNGSDLEAFICNDTLSDDMARSFTSSVV